MNTRGIFAALLAFLRRYSVVIAGLVLAAALALGFLLWPPPPLSVEQVITQLQEAPLPKPESRPLCAIVIDDVGLTEEGTRAALALPKEVTLSFLPYAPHVQEKVNAARKMGHEIFLHMPMEPLGNDDPGPGTLRISMSDDEIRTAAEQNLSRFTGYVGINNHMGSRFTADARGMRVVMEEIKKRGLIFLDSRTTLATKGEQLAREMGVHTLRRHVFLDNVLTEENVANQIYALIKLSEDQNMAVAIGHPHHITLEILAKMLPYLRNRCDLVPVSALAK